MTSAPEQRWRQIFRKGDDPLMVIARILVLLLRIATIVGILAAAIHVVTDGLVFYYALHGQEVPETGPFWRREGIWWPKGPVPVGPAAARAAIPALTIALLALLNAFLGRLSAIIGTVSAGDPFSPDNARRLQRMGLFALAVQILASLIRWLVDQAGPDFVQNVYLSSNLDLSPAGIMLVLTLLILARVFSRGAELRADLEGTV